MSDEPVPEADAMEQDLPVQAPLTEGGDVAEALNVRLDHGLLPEANEADAIEQAQPGPLLDEDDLRD